MIFTMYAADISCMRAHTQTQQIVSERVGLCRSLNLHTQHWESLEFKVNTFRKVRLQSSYILSSTRYSDTNVGFTLQISAHLSPLLPG